MYSFFSQRYREWKRASDLSLKVAHVPGDKMEVDWAGTTMGYVDPLTGDARTLYLFVATLPYSQYTFVKPAESMDGDSLITCNIATLRFFGGVPRIIVPDNLKTGVDAHTPDEVRINRTFQEFGEHYGTAIIPAGMRKPKHKASVEGNVGKIGERIIVGGNLEMNIWACGGNPGPKEDQEDWNGQGFLDGKQATSGNISLQIARGVIADR